MPRFDRPFRIPTLAFAGALALAAGCGGSRGESSYGAGARAASIEDAAPRPAPAVDADLGSGFVVWESNRSGAWRLWIASLADGEPRQLTADEPGRSHCCPHIRPGGAEIAYLSVTERAREYPHGDEAGPLRLVAVDGSGERELVPAARTYFENRAVVWRSPDELVYIDAAGVTRLLDLATGKRRALTADGEESFGWLLDPRLAWATSGTTLFSTYDGAARRVVPASGRVGCQPYFTPDGRWGYWMAAPGGPLDAVELASGRRKTILRKSDSRLPPELGYVYFPMVSAGMEALVFAASANEHDHFLADYELFIAPLDPETLELRGSPRRLTRHPANDRFPDVWIEPLALGRWRGEAPFSVSLTLPAGAGQARWTFGDGTATTGAVGDHTYERPGRYAVTATAGGQTYSGLVLVQPPAPPEIVSTSLEDLGARVVVRFDEPITASAPRFRLASGLAVTSWAHTRDGRGLELELAAPLAQRDSLELAGIEDRAQVPNALPPITVALEPPLWPSSRAGLVLLWQTADAPNLVFDPGLGAERATILTPRGAARLDHDFAMRLAGGSFVASEEMANVVRWHLQSTNEMTLELTVTPSAAPGGSGRLVSMSSGGHGQNFFLAERSGRLVFGLRVDSRGPQAVQEIEIAPLAPGKRTHVVVTYAPARLRVYLDGELVAEHPFEGSFFHWKSYALTFGDEWAGGHDWRGTMEGIALFKRVLETDEIRENFGRYAALADDRPAVARLVVQGRLIASSQAPTLAEIEPYREALAVAEYEVTAVESGSIEADRVRVAEWVLLDAGPISRPAPGSRRRLELEPYALNRQLESVFLADTLPGGEGTPLWYAVGD